MKKVSFSIPTSMKEIKWVVWYPLCVFFRKMRFLLFRFRCMDCGVRCDFRQPQYEYRVTDVEKVLLSSHIGNVGRDCICGNCLAVRISRAFAKGGEVSVGKCDGCLHDAMVSKVMWDPECNIRFGTRWWNGFSLCERCLVGAARDGIPSSGRYRVIGDRVVRLNEVGVEVD